MNTQTTQILFKSRNKKSNSIESLFKAIVEDENTEAFNTLFKIYYTPLCYHALKTVGEMEIAEEIVADVFVKIWKNRHRIQIHSSYQSYLYRAVRNHGLDYLRSSQNDKNWKEPLNEWHYNLLEYSCTEDSLEYKETAQMIENAICRLPRQCQLIFRLNRLDGLKYKEVSEQLNISMKAVEAQMTKALKFLRVELG